eukprot:2549292-Pyramimonas_sp.AAC.1
MAPRKCHASSIWTGSARSGRGERPLLRTLSGGEACASDVGLCLALRILRNVLCGVRVKSMMRARLYLDSGRVSHVGAHYARRALALF